MGTLRKDSILPCILYVLAKLEELVDSIMGHYELKLSHKYVLLMASARVGLARGLMDSVVRYRGERRVGPDDCILVRPGLYGVLGMLDENVFLTKKTMLVNPLVMLSACLEEVENELRSIIIDKGFIESYKNTRLPLVILKITLETIRSLRNTNKLVVDGEEL